MPMVPRFFVRPHVPTRRTTRTYYSAPKTFDLDLIVESATLLGAHVPAKLKRFSLLPRQTVTRPSWRHTLVRKYAQALRDLLSPPLTDSSSALLWRVTGWGYSTFPAFLEELEILGLKGKCFGPSEYAHALAAYWASR
jgi:hypothetical protein